MDAKKRMQTGTLGDGEPLKWSQMAYSPPRLGFGASIAWWAMPANDDSRGIARAAPR